MSICSVLCFAGICVDSLFRQYKSLLMLERQSLEKSLRLFYFLSVSGFARCISPDSVPPGQTSVHFIGGFRDENDFSPPAGALAGFGTFCHTANEIIFHVLFLEIYKLAVHEL